MTEDLLIIIRDEIKKAVKETVNGKIDAIRQDLKEHAERDEKNMVIIREQNEKSNRHMEETRPYLEAATGIKRIGDFIIYLRNIGVAVSGIALAWYIFANKFHL